MMYAVTFICAAAFAAWLIHKGLHWWDDELDVTSTIDPTSLE